MSRFLPRWPVFYLATCRDQSVSLLVEYPSRPFQDPVAITSALRFRCKALDDVAARFVVSLQFQQLAHLGLVQ